MDDQETKGVSGNPAEPLRKPLTESQRQEVERNAQMAKAFNSDHFQPEQWGETILILIDTIRAWEAEVEEMQSTLNSVGRDLGNQRILREKAEAEREALKAENERLRVALEHIPTIIKTWSWEGGGKIRLLEWVNKAIINKLEAAK